MHEPLQRVDLGHLEEYAWMAQLIYRDQAQIEERYGHYDSLVVHDVDAVRGRYMVLVRHAERRQLLVFRGTANWRNIIDDARFISRRDNTLEIAVHQGFLEYATALHSHLRLHCLEILDDDYDTLVVGHSLGGAAAALVGAYLLEDGFDVRFVITFGQPKFTNQKGSAELKTLPLLRVVNHGDAVADVPIFDRDLSSENQYVHLGLELHLLDGEELILQFQETATGEKPGLMRQLLSKVNIDNHMMHEYIDRLSQLLRSSRGPEITVDQKGWFWWKRVHFDWTERVPAAAVP